MGGSGGGPSGTIDYPDYLKDIHEKWLDDNGSDEVDQSIAYALNTAWANNPYWSLTVWDPDSELAVAWGYVSNFALSADSIDPEADWTDIASTAETIVDNIISDAYVDDDIEAYSDLLTDQIDNIDLPKFRSGMLNVNAVANSSYAIGEAILLGFKNRDIAKYAADIRMKLAVQHGELTLNVANSIANLSISKTTFLQAVAQLGVDAKRIAIVAKREEESAQLDVNKNKAIWDLEAFQIAGNFIASVAGGTTYTSTPSNKATSALGGALSGAVVGTQVGGYGWGTAVGAVVGAGASLLK